MIAETGAQRCNVASFVVSKANVNDAWNVYDGGLVN